MLRVLALTLALLAHRRVRRQAATRTGAEALQGARVHQDHGLPAHLDRRGRAARSARSAATTASQWIRPQTPAGSPARTWRATTSSCSCRPPARRSPSAPSSARSRRYIAQRRRLRRRPRRVRHAREVAVVRAARRRPLQASRPGHAEQDRDRRGPHLGRHQRPAREPGPVRTSGTSSARIRARACTCWSSLEGRPLAWCHDYDGGRAVYTAMGHTEASFTEPEYLAAPARSDRDGRRPREVRLCAVASLRRADPARRLRLAGPERRRTPTGRADRGRHRSAATRPPRRRRPRRRPATARAPRSTRSRSTPATARSWSAPARRCSASTPAPRRASGSRARSPPTRAAATVSGNLVLRFTAPGDLLASGHPQDGGLPENLPLIRSTDHGATWQAVPGTAEGDYHELESAGDTIIAVSVDAPDVLVSRDGGKTFESQDAAGAADRRRRQPEGPAAAGGLHRAGHVHLRQRRRLLAPARHDVRRPPHLAGRRLYSVDKRRQGARIQGRRAQLGGPRRRGRHPKRDRERTKR